MEPYTEAISVVKSCLEQLFIPVSTCLYLQVTEDSVQGEMAHNLLVQLFTENCLTLSIGWLDHDPLPNNSVFNPLPLNPDF